MTDTVLVLRTCAADMTAHGGFRWPESGPVEALDWSPVAECGRGLHGALWGEGDGSLLSWAPDARWLVVEVPADSIVDLGGKVKFPWGVVVCCGTREQATQYMLARAPGRAVIGAAVSAGDYGHATAGDYGTATAGYYGHATAGDYGTATAGYGGHATAGYYGHATAGDYGTATAGDYGHATAGAGGHATAGTSGHATAGTSGHATAGDGGHATAGDYGIIQLRRLDGAAQRVRLVTGYVGEGGILPGVAYRLDDAGAFVRADVLEVTP